MPNRIGKCRGRAGWFDAKKVLVVLDEDMMSALEQSSDVKYQFQVPRSHVTQSIDDFVIMSSVRPIPRRHFKIHYFYTYNPNLLCYILLSFDDLKYALPMITFRSISKCVQSCDFIKLTNLQLQVSYHVKELISLIQQINRQIPCKAI